MWYNYKCARVYFLRFRVVACRQVVSTLPSSSAYVVTEFSSHSEWVHEDDPQPEVGEGCTASIENSELRAPRRNSTGRFLPSAFKGGHLQRPPRPDSPPFLPEVPTVVDSKLVMTSGYSIPLLPVHAEYRKGSERIRPQKRPRGDCEHRADSMWQRWEQRIQIGDGIRVVKRPRLRGTGGEDALRAWGWVANLVTEGSELDEEIPLAGVVDSVVEVTVPSRTEQAPVAPPLSKVAPTRRDSVSAGPGVVVDKAAQPDYQRLAAFLTRPTVSRIESAPVTRTRLRPLPITPFTPPSLLVPGPERGPCLRSASPTLSDTASASSATCEFRHETPETSFSPVSPTRYRPAAPFRRAAKTPIAPAGVLSTGQKFDESGEDLQRMRAREDVREQTALEALLELKQFTFLSKSEADRNDQPPPGLPRVQPQLQVDSKTIARFDEQQGSSEIPAPVKSHRVQRKLSRWQRRELPDDETSPKHSASSVPTRTGEDDAPLASADSSNAATDGNAAPPKPAALAFVPRASRKRATARRSLATPLQVAAASTGAPSMAGPRLAPSTAGHGSGTGTGRMRVPSSNAQMAIAFASRHKREADLQEELRNSSVAAANVGGAVEEEARAEARTRKAAEQAEALKHSLWQSGGRSEGGRIDR